MKVFKNIIDNIKPTFSKGGKLEFLHSTFDAFETFLFVPDTVAKNGVHIKDSIDLKRVMTVVIVALMPALLFGMWNTGYQHNLAIGGTMGFWEMFFFGFIKVLPLIIVSYVVGLGIEFAAAQIRGHEVNEGFLVSGMLIPLIMPVDVPLWILALSVAFAVIVGKEVFGGTGMNIWNPALLSRAFVFFAYPSQISGDKIWIAGLSKGEGIIDGFSGATPLANAKAGLAIPSLQDMFLGLIPGSIGETSTIAILIGAAILLFTGIASWRIMLSVFAGGAAIGILINLLAPATAQVGAFVISPKILVLISFLILIIGFAYNFIKKNIHFKSLISIISIIAGVLLLINSISSLLLLKNCGTASIFSLSLFDISPKILIGTCSFIGIIIGILFIILSNNSNQSNKLVLVIGSFSIILIIASIFSSILIENASLLLPATAQVGEIGHYMALPFYYHFVMGGFAFGAVFMATDPVTGSQTNSGKYVYGFLIGVVAIIIRVFNPGYPEGMMLSILLLNTFAPLIDYVVVERNIKRRLKRAALKQ